MKMSKIDEKDIDYKPIIGHKAAQSRLRGMFERFKDLAGDCYHVNLGAQLDTFTGKNNILDGFIKEIKAASFPFTFEVECQVYTRSELINLFEGLKEK